MYCRLNFNKIKEENRKIYKKEKRRKGELKSRKSRKNETLRIWIPDFYHELIWKLILNLIIF